MSTSTDQLQSDIEIRLAGPFPQVELLSCERIGADRLRLFIDHPDGVGLDLCERVTKELGELLADHALEVSSPGPERPLTKPDHFRRYLGRRARVRTCQPRDRGGAVGGAKTFTGELVGATDAEVTVAAEAGLVSIPYTEISRSNLVSGGGERDV
jgi:ribosome maturation factor RimP